MIERIVFRDTLNNEVEIKMGVKVKMKTKFKIKKARLLSLLCLALTIFTFSCANSNSEKEILILGTSIFPPFAYAGGIDGEEVVGFDIEIAKEIAADLDMDLQIEVMEFDSLLSSVANGDIDIAMNAITITEGRKRIVDFSHQYYKSSQAVLIKKENLEQFANIKTKEDLGASEKIGVEMGSTAHILTLEVADKERIFEANSMEALLAALTSENVDALVMDYQTARAFSTKYNTLAVLPIEFDTEFYGIAVKKGNRELLSSIDETINRLINSGEYSKLVQDKINNYSVLD